MNRVDGLIQTLLAAASNDSSQLDDADKIVKQVIEYANDILKYYPASYGVARVGLERMRNILQASDGYESATLRLDEYLYELSRRFPN